MKILNIDIETRPGKAWIWDLKTRYVSPGNVIEPKRMLCFAAKWVGEPRVWFYSTWHDGRLKMLHNVRELLDQADALLYYNGDRFDRRTINTEFAIEDIKPPSPAKSIDLYKTVARDFAFMSKSLGWVSRELGVTTKLGNDGMPMWLRVMRGDREAQMDMRRYNIGDLPPNEAVYARLLPWITNHPSHAALTGEFVCPNCGSDNLTRQGYAYTKTRTYQRYRCSDCGKYSRDVKSIPGMGAEITEVAA